MPEPAPSARRSGPRSGLQGRLHVATAGDPGRPALLLLHAMGTDGRFWDECVARWRDRYRCIVPDLRSAGRSPLADPPAGVAEHAADLETLRQELGITRWVAIGCAMGGAVAAAYAAREPERVAALVMANPGLRNDEAVKAMLRERTDRIRRDGMAVLLPAAAERAFLNLPRDDRYHRYAERYAAQSAEGYAQQVLGFLDVDVAAEVAATRCPLLVVPGEHDVLMPIDSSERIRTLRPDAVVETLPNAAHFGPMQAPEAFVACVDRFLASIPSGAIG